MSTPIPSESLPAGNADHHAAPPLPSDTGRGWPPFCSLAKLARILTMVHGHQAPTESSLKKWSAGGAFNTCIVRDSGTPAPGSARVGRPGIRLDTRRAVARVYELWPHLADTGSQAVIDLAVARVTDSLEARLSRLAPASAAPSPAALTTTRQAPGSDSSSNELLQELLRQMTAMRRDMTEVKREVAQFSALRNNLITKLDDAVARAQAAIGASGSTAASGIDPLVEARRDRDMGVVKSMLGEILEALGRGAR